MKKNIQISLIVISIILLIPLLLNTILQCKTIHYNVIGGEDGPIEWLSFWGAYIGAIGAAMMAWVSYYQSRKESERLSLRTQIEHERCFYDKLEELIVKDVSIHSLSRVYEIKSALKVNQEDANTLYIRLYQDIHFASLYCVAFHSNVKTEEYKQFGVKLAELNQKILDIIEKVDVCEEDSIDAMIAEMKMLKMDIASLIHIGFDALMKQNEIIISLERKLQKL